MVGFVFVLCQGLSAAKLSWGWSPVGGGCGIDCFLFSLFVCLLPVEPGFPLISSGQS